MGYDLRRVGSLLRCNSGADSSARRIPLSFFSQEGSCSCFVLLCYRSGRFVSSGLFNEGVDNPNRIVIPDEVVQTFGQQHELGSVPALDKTLHPGPPQISTRQNTRSSVFTQPGPKAGLPRCRQQCRPMPLIETLPPRWGRAQTESCHPGGAAESALKTSNATRYPDAISADQLLSRMAMRPPMTPT
jgi:hypothetical protein